jgi:hypothetical protein
MKKNLGNADKMIRMVIAAVAALLFFTNVVTGTLGIIVLVAGGVLLATSLINFCPLYAILGINTCPRKA